MKLTLVLSPINFRSFTGGLEHPKPGYSQQVKYCRPHHHQRHRQDLLQQRRRRYPVLHHQESRLPDHSVRRRESQDLGDFGKFKYRTPEIRNHLNIGQISVRYSNGRAFRKPGMPN